MAGAYNFGDLLAQAFENDKQRELQSRQLDINERQFNESMLWNKQKWYEGELGQIKAQTEKLIQEGKAIPKELQLKQRGLENEMQRHRDTMKYHYDSMYNSNEQNQAERDLRKDINTAQLEVTKRGQDIDYSINNNRLLFDKTRWGNEGKTLYNPNTRQHNYRYNSGYVDNSGWVPKEYDGMDDGGVTMMNGNGKRVALVPKRTGFQQDTSQYDQTTRNSILNLKNTYRK